MAANDSKKQIHELFVSNHKGTTLNENYLLIILPLLLQFCHSFWILNFFQLGWGDYKGNILINFVSVVVPTILFLTVLSEYLWQICVFLLIFCVIGAANSSILSRATKYCSEVRLTMHKPNKNGGKIGLLLTSQVRGCVLLSGALCILAVDMNIFPRRWAKTEVYGTGLMDLGVGTFALLMGMMWPSCTNRSRFLYQLAVLCVLGTVRLVMIKQINYQEHESEYGRHWNFFYTLAVVKVTGVLLSRVSSSLPRVVVTLVLLCSLHHYLLTTMGLEAICVKDDMDRGLSLFVANKEGLISLGGYVLLWLVGRLFARLMAHRRSLLACLVVWCFLGHVLVHWQSLAVSRRTANLAYVLWTSVCVAEALLVTLCGDIVLNILEDRANYVNKLECPDIYSIVNRRGLLHFLAANILTGAVNVSLDTLQLDGVKCVLILCMYALVPLIVIHCIDVYHHNNGHKED